MRLRVILISATVLVVGEIATAGCGDGGADGAGVRVVATTGVLADIASHVAGAEAEVTQLIPDSVSPHEFQLSAEDRLKLEQADLVVLNGAGLEAGMPVDDLDAPTWELTDHGGELRPGDPHVWMDPTRVAAALPSLADAIAAVDPPHADRYRARWQEYAEGLRGVDRYIRRRVAPIPTGGRKLVTSHDALGYFADHYGFEVIATAFPATGDEAEPSAATLREVEDAVRASGVPAVFAEAEDDPAVLERVAEDTGVEVVTDLLVETPGPAGSYAEMLRHDAGLIVSALAG
jgi:ABC-type Zn uptake system ZnuABC Zn-binding protein ZnuA